MREQYRKPMNAGNNAVLSFHQTAKEILQALQCADLEKGINDSLAKLRDYFSADRLCLGYFNDSSILLKFIYQAKAPGIPSTIEHFDGSLMRVEAMPLWRKNIWKGIDTIVDRVDNIPEKGKIMKRQLRAAGVKSLLITPVYNSTGICGFLAIEYLREQHFWSDAEIDNIHFFSDLFAIVVENEEMHKACAQQALEKHERSNLAKLQLALQVSNSFLWEYDVKNDKISVDYSLLDEEHREMVDFLIGNYGTEKACQFDYLFPEDKERLQEQVAQLVQGEIKSFTLTYRQYHKDKLQWFTTFFHAYTYDEKGKPETVICLTTDITARRVGEQELFEAKEANRLKNAFIENVSHELRTPLNAIVGFSSILATNNDSEENRYFINIIDRNNQILLRLIDSIISFTALESGTIAYNLESVDVKEICQQAIHISKINKKDTVDFHFDNNHCPLYVRTDGTKVVQMLFHLLDNAFKYTDEGSVSLLYKQINHKEVRVEVTDTGIGLAPDEIDKMYDYFYQADNFRIGLGLGLPIAHRMIRDLQGEHGVESEKGKGATFWFTLPLAL